MMTLGIYNYRHTSPTLSLFTLGYWSAKQAEICEWDEFGELGDEHDLDGPGESFKFLQYQLFADLPMY